MRKIILIIFFLLIGLIGGVFFLYQRCESNLNQTEKLIAEFEGEFMKLEGLTLKAEKILYDFDEIIKTAKFLGHFRFGRGYDALEKIVRNLTYREETEMVYKNVYEALGYIGRFDERALKLLLSEFNPEADPVRAMNVLVGIKLTGNSEVLSKCVSQIVPNYMSSGEVNARLQDY